VSKMMSKIPGPPELPIFGHALSLNVAPDSKFLSYCCENSVLALLYIMSPQVCVVCAPVIAYRIRVPT